MRELTLFYLADCPYCHQARRALSELRREKPELETAAIRWIEESEQRALADRYDYYYVPALFAGDTKLYEAHPGESYDECKAALQKALAAATE